MAGEETTTTEPQEAPTILEACRAALGVTDTYYDQEIELAIMAAQIKRQLGGIAQSHAEDTADPLVRVAIITFVKATVGNDNPDAERYMACFDSYVVHMKLTARYTTEADDG